MKQIEKLKQFLDKHKGRELRHYRVRTWLKRKMKYGLYWKKMFEQKWQSFRLETVPVKM